METIKLAVIDDNESFVKELTDCIGQDPAYQLTGTAGNGVDGCRLIREKEPDVVILDIIMPKMDGLTVMDRVLNDERQRRQPAFVVISAVGREEIAQEAFELGARYYIRKPVDPQTVMAKLRLLSRRENRLRMSGALALREIRPNTGMAAEASGFYFTGNPQVDVTNILQEIGIPAHIRGYQYLRDAVVLALESPSVLESVTRKLYPVVAENFSTTTGRVERAIRHAIEAAWSRGKMEALERIFHSGINLDRGRPTNSEFIAQLTDKLMMEYKISLSNK